MVLDPFTHLWYTIDFDLIPDLENVTFVSGPPVLAFDATGNAPLADSTYVLAAGDQTKTLIVKGINGRIIVK